MTRILEVRKNILKKNDQLAADLRKKFQLAGVCVIDLVSSPGAGKTELLEKTLRSLKEKGYRVAALVGDLETENDANRLARSGVPVRQIETHGICHLEAEMVENHLKDWDLSKLDFLFIENVGNLVCPSSYDLGEDFRCVFLAVTEGEDKPLKYPTIYNSSDVAVITKIDLAEAVEFDREMAVNSIHAVRPEIPILEVSAKKDIGMDEWVSFLENRANKKAMANELTGS
jgi:hydrogenase nickel incorporation protein HypB